MVLGKILNECQKSFRELQEASKGFSEGFKRASDGSGVSWTFKKI